MLDVGYWINWTINNLVTPIAMIAIILIILRKLYHQIKQPNEIKEYGETK